MKTLQPLPVLGDDVYLSIDSDWQSAIWQILKQRVAGVLLTRIENTKKFDFEGVKDASQISVPIYDVYNALVANSVIDIEKFNLTVMFKIQKKFICQISSTKAAGSFDGN